MTETIAFDALTAIVTAHHLEARRLSTGLVAWLMHEAARENAEVSRNGVRVTIKGWTAIGDPVVEGGFTGTYSMKVTLPAKDGATKIVYAGKLSRKQGRLVFATAELGFGDSMRLVSNHGSSLKLEIRQQLPDTLMNGLTALKGRPLSMLAGHPAFARDGGDMITISEIHDRSASTRSRIGMPGPSGGPGVDVEISAPAVMVEARR